MTANESKAYLPYFIKLVDQYSNAYHHSITKKSIDADFSVFTEKIVILKEMIEIKSHIPRIFLVTVTLQIGQEKHLSLILV